jgi:hypothetical protein
MLVIARPATDLGHLLTQHRDDSMVSEAAALDAVVVDDVAQAEITHRMAGRFLNYIKQDYS